MNQPMQPQMPNTPPSGAVQQPQPNPNPYQAPNPKKPIYKKWWFWLIIVVIIVAIGGGAAGSGGGEGEPAPAQDAAPAADAAGGDAAAADNGEAEAQSDYTIADEAFVDNGYGSYSVTGTFTNTSGKDLNYVQVSYRMLDAEGAQIGTAWANTSNLPAAGVWKFDAMYFDTDAAPASFQLAEVSSY